MNYGKNETSDRFIQKSAIKTGETPYAPNESWNISRFEQRKQNSGQFIAEVSRITALKEARSW